MSSDDSIRIRSTQVLSSEWATLTKTTFDHRRRDGRWQTLVRQTFDRGNGAAVLPYDAKRGRVLLVQQFRFPVFLGGADGWLIEACAGVLDDDDPETCARREAEEELGYRLTAVEHVLDAYMSPGAVTEKLSLFIAPYGPSDRVGAGGGHPDEGEDIEVLELSFTEAIDMIGRGEIRDAKTVLLLQHLQLAGRMAVGR